jgi:hypothetical protein
MEVLMSGTHKVLAGAVLSTLVLLATGWAQEEELTLIRKNFQMSNQSY